MDNAGCRNIHARSSCGEAGTDRQGRRRTGTADSACRRVFADRDMRLCDRFRPNSPAWACTVPNCRTTIPGPTPQRRLMTGMYGVDRGSRVPNLGENREEIVRLFADCAKTDALSAAQRTLPSSSSSYRRDGQGPRRSFLRARQHRHRHDESTPTTDTASTMAPQRSGWRSTSKACINSARPCRPCNRPPYAAPLRAPRRCPFPLPRPPGPTPRCFRR